MNDSRINKIEAAYNPERDTPHGIQPQVTWVDMALLELIEQLNAKIEKLEKKISGEIDEAEAMFRQHQEMKMAMQDNISPAELGLQEAM